MKTRNVISALPSEPILKAHKTDIRLNRESWTFCWTQRKLTPGRIRSDSARCALDDGRFGRENSALLKLRELRNEPVSQKMAPYLFCYSNVPPAAAGPSWISTLYMRHSVFGVCVFRTCQPNVFSDRKCYCDAFLLGKRDVRTLTPPDFYKTFHSSSLNQVLIWPGFNVCFKLTHHNEKSWQDYLGVSFLDLAELHCFHNYNEDT